MVSPLDQRVAVNRAAATPLTNRTVSGSGDFVVEADSGRPFSQESALGTGVRELWYRFSTLGDGVAGNRLELEPAFEGVRTVLLRGEDGRISALGQVQIGDVLTWGRRPGRRWCSSWISRPTWIG